MLTCREIADLLDIYLDGELDAERCAAVLGHLKQCPTCNELLSDRIRETERILNGFPVPPLAPDFKERTMLNVAAYADRPHFFPRPGYFLNRPWLAPALAGLILLVSVWGVYSHKTPPLTVPKQSIKGTEQTKSGGSTKTPGDVSRITAGGYPGAASGGNPATPPVAQEDKLLDSSNNEPGATLSEKRAGSEVYPSARSLFYGTGDAEAAGGDVTDFTGLLRSGYVVFTPTYLPPGYEREEVVLLSGTGEDSAGHGMTEDNTSNAQNPFALIFRNPQTGAEIRLQVVPTNPYALDEPVTTADSPYPDERQPEGESSISWYAEKGGVHFILTLSGNLARQELKKVADSIQ